MIRTSGNRMRISLIPHRRCKDCGHVHHVGNCGCLTKACSCLQWRLTAYTRNLPEVFGG